MTDPTDDPDEVEGRGDPAPAPDDRLDIGTEFDDPDDDGALPPRDELGDGQDIAFAFG